MRNQIVKRIAAVLLAGVMIVSLAACGGNKKTEEKAADDSKKETEIQVFIAASLNTVMTELAKEYNEDHPEVKITFNADSSGTLLTQIEEGYECDLFFSAAQKQMDQLEADGLVVDGTRANVLNNQVVVISLKDSGTKVTGLENLKDAKSIALAGGSVPVGKYTRQALVNLGTLKTDGEVDAITTAQVSQALGGVEISEEDNVSKVLTAVAEGSNEVGVVYATDATSNKDVKVLAEAAADALKTPVIYPVAALKKSKNKDAADKFVKFLQSEKALKVFRSYGFTINK